MNVEQFSGIVCLGALAAHRWVRCLGDPPPVRTSAKTSQTPDSHYRAALTRVPYRVLAILFGLVLLYSAVAAGDHSSDAGRVEESPYA